MNSNLPTTDHLGNEYSSFTAMCKAYGRDKTSAKKQYEQGWSIKDILEYKGREVVKDHKGKEYASVEDKCASYGISYRCYMDRLDKGMSEQEALETPVRTRKKQVPYKGVNYPSVEDFCSTFNIPLARYYNGLSLGWSLDRIVTEEKGRTGALKRKLKALDITKEQWYRLKNQGWSEQKIENTGKAHCICNSSKSKEHKIGTIILIDIVNTTDTTEEYLCKCEKCGAFDILEYKDIVGHKYVCNNNYKPKTDEKSIESAIEKCNKIGLDGTIYNSCKEMVEVETNGELQESTFRERLKRKNMSKREALTLQVDDDLEQLYSSIPKATVQHLRFYRGFSLVKIKNTNGLSNYLVQGKGTWLCKVEDNLKISIEGVSFETDTNVWYKCECRKCKMKDIWNYRDMLEHSQVCK